MNTADELAWYFCPFGYLDLKAACAIGDGVWIFEQGLFDIIDDFRENIGLEGFSDIDPVYCILEHILQSSRNLIEDVSGYDFINDHKSGWTEIYTYWNFMCSSYDYSETAREELMGKLQSLSLKSQDILLLDDQCRYFLNELEITLSGTD